jgi:phospholipase C
MRSIIKILLPVSLGMVLANAETASFQHVIVIVQENRTPDNLFQGLCVAPYGSAAACSTMPTESQYNIQTSNWLDKASPTGTIQPGALALSNEYDMSHTHTAFVQMCNPDPQTGVCRMNGAHGVGCAPSCPKNTVFSYVNNASGILNPYLDLATQYGWANYMFQTNQGPSFPAHQFLFGGTSAPSAADDAAGIFASENPVGSAIVGCIAPVGTTVQVINSSGSEKEAIYPCFEHQTMADLLAPQFTWRYYTPTPGSIWTAPNAIQHICESNGPGGKCTGKDWSDNVDLKPADVLTDIATCNLQSVSWVIPSGVNSDHAGINDGGGPSWVASIVNAVGKTNCDYWDNTAILITWDDWGGWYDHEPPTILAQPEGDYQYGFRVPLIVVSAFTPQGYINNDRQDFGSILRFIERNFGISEGALHFADARSNGALVNFFPLLFPRQFKPLSTPKDANFFLNDTRTATDPDDDQ